MTKTNYTRRLSAINGAAAGSVARFLVEPLEKRVLLSAQTPVPAAPYMPPGHLLQVQRGYLSKPAQGKPLTIALNYLRTHTSALGLKASDLANPLVARQYTDRSGNTHIELLQRVNALEIANANLAISLTKDNRVISVSSRFVGGATSKNTKPALTAQQALAKVLTSLGLASNSTLIVTASQSPPQVVSLSAPKLSGNPIVADKEYLATRAKGLKLAWKMVLPAGAGRPGYQVYADANTGANLGTIVLADAASTTITVTLPSDGWEGQSLSGSVQLSASSSSPLTVNLLSSDTNTLAVPAMVTVAAGQKTASFTAMLVNDGVAAGSRSASITASASGIKSGNASVTVHDSALDHLAIDPITSQQTAGALFPVTVRAYNVANEMIAVYGGAGTLTAAGQSGSLSVSPGSFNFAGGKWSGNCTMTTADPAAVLTAASAAVSALSNAFAVNALQAHQFVFSTIPSPQIANLGFAVTITAEDPFGNKAPSYDGEAALQGGEPAGPYDFYIPVSPETIDFVNGVWTGNVTVPDSQWSMRLEVYDLSGTTGGGFSYSGYFSTQVQSLDLAMPADVWENAGTLNQTLNVAPPPASDMTVSLVSSDPSRLSVPDTVIVPAGASAVPIPVTVIDNTLLDGPQAITVTATSNQKYSSAASTINVHDNETASLSISLPTSAREGDGTMIGTITASAAPARDVTVQLSGSHPDRASVPATVVLPAGQTSVNFDVGIVDDDLINGTATATVQAGVDNWTTGYASMNIKDNDNFLTLTLPPSGWEGTRNLTGTFGLGGTYAANLPVTFTSDDSDIILGTTWLGDGTISGFLGFNILSDNVKQGTRTATITESAPGMVSATASIVIHDSNLDHLAFDPVNGPQTAGVAFGSTIRAYNVSNEVIANANYGMPLSLTATGQAGDLPVTATNLYFGRGVATPSVTLTKADPAVRLTASISGVSMTSNVFAVQAGAVASFAWGAVSTPQFTDIPFLATLSAEDAYNNLTNYNGPVTLSGLLGTSTVVPISPTSDSFVNGNWSGNITVAHAAAGMHLHAEDGSSHTGDSSTFDVQDPVLSLELPNDVKETDGLIAGTLKVTPALASDLTVALASSDPARLSAPANVKIPAGATSVAVTVIAIDNNLLDGLEAVRIAASANDSVAARRVNVHDDETATISVSLPPDASEGDGAVIGTLTASAAPTQDITVQLASDNPARATAPATVVLPAGQTTTTFKLTIVNDMLIDGTATVNVSANVDNWTGGSAGISIADNDNFMTLQLPSSVWESTSYGAMWSVSIGGTVNSNLVVNLSTDDPKDLTFPATVTIPAGKTSASFGFSVVANGWREGTRVGNVRASAPGLTDGNATVTVHDSTLDHLTFDPLGSSQLAGVAFTTTVRAYNVTDELIPLFNSFMTTLTAAGQNGTYSLPQSSILFNAGVGSAKLVLTKADPALRFIDTYNDVSGTSNVFAVKPRSISSFSLSSIASPQLAGAPFATTIRATDIYGNVVADFNGSANISGTTLSSQLQDTPGSSAQGLDTLAAVAVVPSAVTLVNGVWSGNLSIAGAQSGVQLHVADASQHAGDSNTFDVVAASVSAPDLGYWTDSGMLSDDNLTRFNNSQPSLAPGFVVDGTMGGYGVRVYADGQLIGAAGGLNDSTVVICDGSTKLSDGTHLITARLVNRDGGQTDDSPGLSITIDTTPPTLSLSSTAAAPGSSVVGSLLISASEPITGLTPASLSLTRDGGANLLTPAQTLFQDMPNSYVLGNLAEIDARAGTYALSLSPGQLADVAGNFSDPLKLQWTTDPLKGTAGDDAYSFKADGDQVDLWFNQSTTAAPAIRLPRSLVGQVLHGMGGNDTIMIDQSAGDVLSLLRSIDCIGIADGSVNLQVIGTSGDDSFWVDGTTGQMGFGSNVVTVGQLSSVEYNDHGGNDSISISGPLDDTIIAGAGNNTLDGDSVNSTGELILRDNGSTLR
jgi:hypothetical protein